MKQLLTILFCLWHGGYLSAQVQETFWHWQAIDTVRVVCTYDYSEYFTFRSEHLKEHEDYLLQLQVFSERFALLYHASRQAGIPAAGTRRHEGKR